MFIILLGAFSGLLLGITGGGGAIVAVPALVYGLHLPMQVATTLSLFVVGASAMLGTYLKRKDVDWQKGIIFAIAGGIATPFGIYFAHKISEPILIMSFAILMLIVSFLMFRKSMTKIKKDSSSINSIGSTHIWQILPIALLTGFFGVGGGFMIVPALVLINRMESKPAVATSLFIITLISLFSIANKVSEVTLDFKLIIIFLLGSVIGMIIGGVIAQKISNSTSQRIFALVAFIIGVYMVFDSMFNL
jgi:uncharacterized membrane protein YfcA